MGHDARRRRLCVLAGALTALVACASSPAPPTCPAQASCRKEYTCSDYGGFRATDLAGLAESCMAGGHPWSDAPCDRTATIGRCEFTKEGTCETQWVFASALPVSERRLSCTSAGGIWREP
jgi:hypothetical protein